ncbi:MAG: hypothetical protein HY877_01910 [Deltaproteobacteria bacterium]|nr:hypothetical protein [Deltaproteobacteria bacterium]
MIKISVIFFIGYFLFLSSVHALQNCEAAPEKFHVVFVNGIWTSRKDAQKAKDKLVKVLGESFQGQEITYDLAYNYTDGPFEDLVQAADQNLAQYSSQIFLWLYQMGNIPGWFQNLQDKLFQAEYEVAASELSTHIEKYREAILQGQKVMVVSHSQGNFYANEAQQILADAQPSIPMTSFGIFGVATPTNNVGGIRGDGAPYLTNHRDIITVLRLLGALPHNHTLKKTLDNSVANDLDRYKAHGFINTYLSSDFDIAPALVVDIQRQLAKLQDPPQIVGSGPITVTVTWNLDNADVDLHLFEPDQTHVYYKNLKGVSGFLDLDNKQGFGPEHYYTDCNQLQVGEYTIALNYYEDHNDNEEQLPARPVTANVTITVPNGTRTFTQILTDDIQTAGNDNPVKIATVTVNQIVAPDNPGLNGKLKYRIVESQ